MHSQNDIPDFVTIAIEYGNQVIAARARRDAENAARIAAEERAERAAAWKPVLATIHQATPSWVHDYITIPDDAAPKNIIDYTYETSYAPAIIDLSALIADIPPIRVWAIPHVTKPRIHFEAGRYSLVQDDDFEAGVWCVILRFDIYRAIDHDMHYFQPGVEGATDDFHAALAQAVADRTDRATLQAEADRRNAATPAEPVEAVEAVDADPLTRIAEALERLTSLYMANQPY